MRYEFKAKVWLYPGDAAWHFITLPKGLSAEIKQLFGDARRGFGSLPVKVTLGTIAWQTSIFPDNKIGAYLLPIKAAVRRQAKISVGDVIKLKVEMLIK